MKQFLLIFLILISGTFSIAQPVKILLVTGGRDFDAKPFFDLFDQLDGIEYEHYSQPKANQILVKDLAEDYDVLVFYDEWQNISETEKSAYMQLAAKGKPFLFIHQSIMSYQKWPEFENLLGGRYLFEAHNVSEELVSTKDADIWVYADVENYTAVTVGFRQIRFFDEAYDNVQVAEDIIPLLKTKHPKSMEYVAWQHKYKASDVVYVQPGYDSRTFESEDYRKLIKQAILFLAKKKS